MIGEVIFPFIAISGQERVKKAITIALVNPKVDSLLISGEKGTGKSTLVRGVAELTENKRYVVTVPLNVSEEMLFGTVDMERALINGQKEFLPGIVSKANGKVAYVDEVNLLRNELLVSLLDINSAGINRVEREGISHVEQVSYTVIGTMNPEEGTLPKQVLDRFGLFVEIENITDLAERVKVIKDLLAYESNKLDFCLQYQDKTNLLSSQIKKAKDLIQLVEISDAMIMLAAQYCTKAFCEGHRAELYLLEAAKSIAALDERKYVLPQDIEEAAIFILPHRTRNIQNQEDQQEQQNDDNEQNEEQNENNNEDNTNEVSPPDNSPLGETEASENDDKNDNETESNDNSTQHNDDNPALEEKISDIDKTIYIPKLQINLGKDRKIRRGSGKRSSTRTDLKQGRYVRAKQTNDKIQDLAFDATVRAAAPYQRFRKHERCMIKITKEDLRSKVREKRIGNTFIFLVDASGSMGARERMSAVKGAIFQMLQEAYQKRDRVGMIAFRRNQAEILLPVTRSIDLAQKCLQQLPTGGKTPLSAGLLETLNVLNTLNKKEKDTEPIVILLTDGRANAVSEDDVEPVETALKYAEKFNKEKITSLVIDTENAFIKLGIAKNIAQRMGASYYQLNKLSKEQILKIVRNN